MKKILLLTFVILCCADLDAQNPWVLGKGQTNLSFGYSRKTAGKRWYPNSIDTHGTPSGADDTWGADSLQEASNLIDGKFHDFRYVYFAPEFGLGHGFEFSAMFLYLDGWERIERDPATGASITPKWEVNRGMTDFWLRLKYQLPVRIPMALEINSRFPDFYEQPGKEYSRYIYQKVGSDTIVEASSEWRGLGKRDLAILYHIGNSFGANYRLFVKGQLGYNIRQGAYADQIIASIGAGYSFPVKNVNFVPNILVDYTGGIGNGETPDYSDRFYSSGRTNFYFNNSKTLRVYYSLYAQAGKRLGFSAGWGQWIWGRGAVKYSEPFVQATYFIR